MGNAGFASSNVSLILFVVVILEIQLGLVVTIPRSQNVVITLFWKTYFDILNREEAKDPKP